MATQPTDKGTLRSVAPVRLSMLNLNEKVDLPAPSSQKRPSHYLSRLLSDDTKQAIDSLRQQRGEIALMVHAHDDNNRINERDPSVCLNYVLLKQWFMMNGLEMYDIDHLFN